MPKRPPRHGTPTAYNWHKCRCDVCKKGWSAYRKAKGYDKKDRSKPYPPAEPVTPTGRFIVVSWR